MRDPYDDVDKGCNCRHPVHGGHRCGRDNGGSGKCSYCRNKHHQLVSAPITSTETTTAAATETEPTEAKASTK